jgi:hypothetical protein
MIQNDKHALQAAFTNEIRLLLIPYIMSRAQITWLNGKKKKLTMYANEHSVTYEQCRHGHAKAIVLDRLQGYTGLITYIEKHLRNIKKAVIYLRPAGSLNFDVECRRYYDGKFEPAEDTAEPVLDASHNIVLQYQVINNRVVIIPPGTEPPPPVDDGSGIDFAKLMEEQLNKK